MPRQRYRRRWIKSGDEEVMGEVRLGCDGGRGGVDMYCTAALPSTFSSVGRGYASY